MFEQGRPLSIQERDLFKPYFASIVIERVRIVEGKVPFWLSEKMCAVVLGRRIFFRAGAYQPNTKQGVGLLGHELTHVSQFLHGMTILSYVWSCRNGYMQSPYEIEAYAKGHLIAKNFHKIAL